MNDPHSLQRRRIGGLLGLAGLAALLPPGLARAAAPAPDVARILQRKELLVAMLATDTPPFFYQRDGQLRGLDVDIAQDIARELGVAVRFDRSAASFNAVVEQVARGEADLGISKISRTLARARSVRFSTPYLTLHHALILNRLEFARLARDRSAEQALQHYSGSLGVIAKSSFEDFARSNFPRATLRSYPGWSEVVAAVERGEVAGGYRDEFEVKRLLAERPSLALRLRTVTLKDRDDTIGVVLHHDAPTLQSFVNLLLSMRRQTLRVDDVLKALPEATGGKA
ncbi:MAG: amino acid ABC transporter substrate-binding protein [Burkholderiaceae bacterium]|nr:amino acid ABC transporter substrate-binding protein [Burkholderiaceae bacterium]